MKLRSSEPFEDADDTQIPICHSSNRTAFYAQVISWIIIILAAVLAITALAKCSAVQEDLPTVNQQVQKLARSDFGEENRMIKILISGKCP